MHSRTYRTLSVSLPSTFRGTSSLPSWASTETSLTKCSSCTTMTRGMASCRAASSLRRASTTYTYSQAAFTASNKSSRPSWRWKPALRARPLWREIMGSRLALWWQLMRRSPPAYPWVASVLRQTREGWVLAWARPAVNRASVLQQPLTREAYRFSLDEYRGR